MQQLNLRSQGAITTLPKAVLRLENLTGLDLQGVPLHELPAWLTQAKSLNTLGFWWRKSTAPPEWAFEFNRLHLSLRDTNLTSLPDWLGQLTNLTSLDLGSNNLTILPDWLGQLPNLISLNLRDNPIEAPPLEVLDLDNIGRVNLENIRNYYRQLQEEGVERLYEAKLLIIGEAGAGKTTLAKKIKDPDYPLTSDEASTEGIAVTPWGFSMENGQPFRVNIWDFGGQEIYHATHQFFLTKRSLYTLVADTRQEDTDFYYWLNIVELFSDNSPLLIIKNEKQDRQREINERQLRGQFTHFKETLATNLANKRGLADIVTSIKHYICHLPHIGDALPKT